MLVTALASSSFTNAIIPMIFEMENAYRFEPALCMSIFHQQVFSAFVHCVLDNQFGNGAESSKEPSRTASFGSSVALFEGFVIPVHEDAFRFGERV